MAEKIKSLFMNLLKEFNALHAELATQESAKIEAGDYDSARSLLSDLKTVAKYRIKVEELSKGWQLNTSFSEHKKIRIQMTLLKCIISNVPFSKFLLSGQMAGRNRARLWNI